MARRSDLSGSGVALTCSLTCFLPPSSDPHTNVQPILPLLANWSIMDSQSVVQPHLAETAGQVTSSEAVTTSPSTPAKTMAVQGPVPMSFPALLRGPGLSDRFAHLRTSTALSETTVPTKRSNRRDDKEGKRWIRRKENGPSHVSFRARIPLSMHVSTTSSLRR